MAFSFLSCCCHGAAENWNDTDQGHTTAVNLHLALLRIAGRDAGLLTRHPDQIRGRRRIRNPNQILVHNFLEENGALTVRLQKGYVGFVKTETEPMQQPIRKGVGRPLTVSQRLAHLEDLTGFLKKHAHGALAKSEGDFFPVRKTVGYPRKGRS